MPHHLKQIADLGFKIGTTTGGVDVAAAITDGVLDNAGDGSSLVEENSIIVLTASLAAAAVPEILLQGNYLKSRS